MTQFTIPSFPGALLLSFEYDSTGLGWVIVRDSYVLAWVIDQSVIGPPMPVYLGENAPTPPDTGDILSPPFAVRAGGAGTAFVIPKTTLRGDAHRVLNFISQNNGAQRVVYADFHDPMLIGAWQEWAANNPMATYELPVENLDELPPEFGREGVT